MKTTCFFRSMRRLSCVATFTFFLYGVSGCAEPLTAVKEGDLIFHTSRSPLSQAIQEATSSRYSHMGIIFYRQDKPYVFEASAKVEYTPLNTWIARGERKHYVVKRLKDISLTPEDLAKMHKAADAYFGKPYDLAFEWSDDRLYCSELVWKIYQNALGIQIGKLQKIRDFNLDTPVVKKELKARYGDHVPLDETVISPQAMFESPLLAVAAER
ncbi:MAG: YiiX family permuted papain-like enzyme [Burkholderiales bacterium]|nr:YiiX family permuted papain-like enzyme [Burkholderiales bacterium]